jgi:hypothetical protein
MLRSDPDDERSSSMVRAVGEYDLHVATSLNVVGDRGSSGGGDVVTRYMSRRWISTCFRQRR